MNFEIALSSINSWVAETKSQSLSPWEREIFRHSWDGDKYDDMNISGYSVDYIRKILAPKLWKLLSEVIGETVTKKNLKMVIASALEKRNSQKFSYRLKLTISYRNDTSNVDESSVHKVTGNYYKSLSLSLQYEDVEFDCIDRRLENCVNRSAGINDNGVNSIRESYTTKLGNGTAIVINVPVDQKIDKIMT
ncbi:hypothetical protein BCD67_12225 [Oscillatoriales cyanobacterium USR001]|nr:hypothetical protein BCD67_12225 [Oscillatoriales cyanobacterium USR001]